MEKLVLIDGYSLLHRAFYAIPATLTKNGEYTNALYGFFNMLLKVLQDARPDYLIVTLDAHAPTFRHKEYAEYKAGRRPMPEEMRPQVQRIRPLLEKIGIMQKELPGFEADDLMGTYSRLANEQCVEAILITGDRDTFQLIGEHTRVWFTKKGITELEDLTPETLMALYSLRPDQVPDLKGLMGDASDNIPGIPGIGEKTAQKLLAEYDKLENVLDNGENIKGKLGERVVNGKESALTSKHLATIVRDAPVEFVKQNALAPQPEAFAEAFTELGFKTLLDRLHVAKEEKPAGERKNDGYAWQNEITLDTEAAVLSFIEQKPAAFSLYRRGDGLCVADSFGRVALLPVSGDLLTPGFEEGRALTMLSPWLEGDAEKRLFDVKQWRTELHRLSLTIAPPYADVGLMGYLIEPSDATGVEKLCDRQGGAQASATAIYELADSLAQTLKEQGMWALYSQVELPLCGVLYDMEREGFKVDRGALAHLQEEFGTRLTELQREIYEVTGESFNILSPKQLGHVLFEVLGLPSGKKTKSGYSTDADVLEGLADAHPAVSLVLQYRAYSKLKSTYVDGLLKLSDENGFIHTTLNQMVTATGRISSAEPNLQNIPVRTDMGRELRRVFVPSGEGNVLVDADYSQIELRVLAAMAGETNMIAAFKNGADIHASTAAQIYDVPVSEVTSAMRSSAKAVNFGIVYGISDFGLARNIGVSRKTAGEFIEKYFARYPKIKEYMNQCVRAGHEQGYVTTLLGRRRNLPELSASNFNTRSFGERAAMNTPIQGTAADIIKVAMVRVAEALEQEHLAARLILQVHDELIIDCPKEEEERAAALLQREMENAVSLSVPLIAEVKTGRSWYETK